MSSRRSPQEALEYVVRKVDLWIDHGLPAEYAFKVVSHLSGVQEDRVEDVWLRSKAATETE